MGASIRLGKVLGIPIGVNYSWILVFLLFTYLLSRDFGDSYSHWPVLQRWGIAAVTSILFFLSVLAHELSHSVVAVRKGIPVRGITLFIFGGVSQLAHEARRPFTEFLVAVVGPATSVGLGLVLLGLRYLFDGAGSPLEAVVLDRAGSPLEAVVSLLGWINLSLGVFNMLPGFPLDGGRVLRAAVWGISRSYWRGTQVATRGGQVIGALMIVGGIASVMLLPGRNFSGIWTVFIGGFLLSAATASYRQERLRESLRSYRIADVMATDWVLLPGETPLDSPLVAQGLAGREGLVGISVAGQTEGILTRRRLAEAPPSTRADTPIADVMLPLSSIPQITPDEEVFSALERMENESLDRLAVFRHGILLGFVSRDNAFRFVRARGS